MQVLIFTINGYKYAIENKYIDELIRRQKIQPMSSTSKYLAGCTNVRDTIYTCIDLCGVLFDKRANYSINQIFILTQSKIAYIVDTVETVVDLDISTVFKPSIIVPNKKNTVIGYFKLNQDIVTFLNFIGLDN